jgi:hypothetical protein
MSNHRDLFRCYALLSVSHFSGTSRIHLSDDEILVSHVWGIIMFLGKL